MLEPLLILFGAGLTIATCMGMGRLLFYSLSLKFGRGEGEVLSFIAGLPCLSLVVFLMTAVGLARASMFAVVAGITLALGVFAPVGQVPDLPNREGRPGTCPTVIPRSWKALFLSIFGAFTVLYFFNAMAPEISPDGTAYHLGLVNRYLNEGHFPVITTNMYASLSEGVEMLFLFAFAFGRHSAAALVHFGTLVALSLAMLFYARRFGFPVAGAVAALLVYCAPVVGKAGASAYVDVATACAVFGVFYLLQLWDRERTSALLVPIGLLAGFAYAAKYTAFVALPYALGFVAWKLYRARIAAAMPHKPQATSYKPLLVMTGCALLMIVPWMAKNVIEVQNPVSPFLNSVFSNPHVHVSLEESYRAAMRHDDRIKSGWDLAWEATGRGSYLAGIVGPLFLLAPFGLFSLRHRSGRQLLLAAAVFGLGYSSNIQTRFLIPALPFVALAMAMTFARWRILAALVLVAHAALSWPAVMKKYAGNGAWQLNEIPVRAALRLESEDAYFKRLCPGCVMARMLDRVVPPGKRVLSTGQVAKSYTSREVLVGYEGALNSRLIDVLRTGVDQALQPNWLLRFRFPPQALRSLRVVQTAADPFDMWSISEMRLFHGERELSLGPHWLVRAFPYPWDAGLAFDKNPVTRWRSWQHLFPGMYMRLDFDWPEVVDTVLLECSRDQWQIRLKLEGQDTPTEWKTLAGAPEYLEGRPPTDMRRLASRAVRDQGIDYLLIDKDDALAKDMAGRMGEWNLTLVAAMDGDALYRLEQ